MTLGSNTQHYKSKPISGLSNKLVNHYIHEHVQIKKTPPFWPFGACHNQWTYIQSEICVVMISKGYSVSNGTGYSLNILYHSNRNIQGSLGQWYGSWYTSSLCRLCFYDSRVVYYACPLTIYACLLNTHIVQYNCILCCLSKGLLLSHPSYQINFSVSITMSSWWRR